MAASHPRRGCRLCLAEGSDLRHAEMKGITSGKNPPVGRKLSYSPDIHHISTRGGANALSLVVHANE